MNSLELHLRLKINYSKDSILNITIFYKLENYFPMMIGGIVAENKQ